MSMVSNSYVCCNGLFAHNYSSEKYASVAFGMHIPDEPTDVDLLQPDNIRCNPCRLKNRSEQKISEQIC